MLQTSYFPSTKYLSDFISNPEILIEAYENFPKQTFRNRCILLNSQGELMLTVPLKNIRSSTKVLTKDVKIDNEQKWQKQHYKSIQMSYSRAPYFIYYVDMINLFFEKKYEYLIDLNNEILLFYLKVIKSNQKINLTNEYFEVTKEQISLHTRKEVKLENEFQKKSLVSFLHEIMNQGPKAKLCL